MKSEFELGADGVYRCRELMAFPFVEHGFGSRGGNPHCDLMLRQIHSDQVLNAVGLTDREREGDGLITDIPGQAIGVRTADCVPILLLDPVTQAVAAVHAGWRGSAAGIVMKAVGALGREFGAAPKNVRAVIGPAIHPCCYEVGPDVAQHFLSLFPEWHQAGSKGDPGRRALDLPEANRRQLTAAGVPAEHIFSCDLCTSCSTNQLFSYRREPANPGRMISSIQRLA